MARTGRDWWTSTGELIPPACPGRSKGTVVPIAKARSAVSGQRGFSSGKPPLGDRRGPPGMPAHPRPTAVQTMAHPPNGRPRKPESENLWARNVSGSKHRREQLTLGVGPLHDTEPRHLAVCKAGVHAVSRRLRWWNGVGARRRCPSRSGPLVKHHRWRIAAGDLYRYEQIGSAGVGKSIFCRNFSNSERISAYTL